MRNSSWRSRARYGIVSTALLLSAPLAAFALDPLHPLGKTTLSVIAGRLIGALLSFTGTLALVVFIWSGFAWMMAGGAPEKIKSAKQNMVYATIGLIVCFSSFTVLNYFFNNILVQTLRPTGS